MKVYHVVVVTVIYLVELLYSEAAATNGCTYNVASTNISVIILSPSVNEACECVITANNDSTKSLYMDINVMNVQAESAATCWPVVHVVGKYYMCARNNTKHSTMKYMEKQKELQLRLYNTQHDQVTVNITLEASTGDNFNIHCQAYSQPLERECPCPITSVAPFYPATDRGIQVGTRFLIGFLSAFFFLCAFGGIWLSHRWYKRRETKRRAAHILRVPKVAKTNLAFDGPTQSKGSGIYAEIRDPYTRSFDILPDATLNLSLQTPSGSLDDGYKGSSDSGLYSTPNNHIQYIPEPPYSTVKSANNFETISPYETAPAQTRRPHTPPLPAPVLTAEEIDAMYAKPNKRKVLRETPGRWKDTLPESGVLVSNNLYISLSELDSAPSGNIHASQTLETDL